MTERSVPEGAGARRTVDVRRSKLAVRTGVSLDRAVRAIFLGWVLLAAACSSEGIRRSDVSTRVCFDPPDVDIAVSPGWQIQTVNFLAVIQNRTTSTIFRRRVSDITGCPGFDPQVTYDAAADRFVMVSIEPFVNPGNWCIAASASGNPMGAWYRVKVSPKTETTPSSAGTKVNTWPDYPGLGITPDKVVVTGNLAHNLELACVQHSGIVVVDKAALYAGAAAVATTYINPLAGNGCPSDPLVFLQPAIHYTPAPGNDAYLVGHNSRGAPAKKVWVFKISGPANAVSVSRAKITLPNGRFIRQPANARQANSSTRINTNDHRMLPNGVVARGNQLYTVFHHGCTPSGDSNRRSCLRILQINVNGDGTATLAQDHRIAEVGRYLYFPAVTVNAHNELLAVTNRSAANLPIQIAVTGRAFADPANTVRDIRVLTNSPATFTGCDDRWGDYNGASLDRNSLDSFFAAEYTPEPTDWGSKIVSVFHYQLPAH